MQNVVMHLDMNSYFATVEQQENSAWRNKPLGVCEHLGGIIIAASVQAKKWGIKTGTLVWEAKKIYPKIILTKTNPEKYRFYTKRFVKLVSEYTGTVELYSIDEVFMDITRVCNIQIINNKSQITNKFQIPNSKINPFEEAVRIAQEIKRRFPKEVGNYLTCSIGIGENKLLAKIASNMKKPDGLVVISNHYCHSGSYERQRGLSGIQNVDSRFCGNDRKDDYLIFAKNELYNYLKLTDIPGIGSRTERSLKFLGIHTLKDLKNYPKSKLVVKFGIHGEHLYNMGQLKSSFKPNVEQEEEIKSMGHMYTVPKRFRERKFFKPVLFRLCEMVGERLRKKQLMGRTVFFYVSFGNNDGFGKSKRVGHFIWDGKEIFRYCLEMAKKFNIKLASFKAVSVTIASLRPISKQGSLFGDVERNKSLLKAFDSINKKYGGFTICHAQMFGAKNVFRDSIGFGKIKEFKDSLKL